MDFLRHQMSSTFAKWLIQQMTRGWWREFIRYLGASLIALGVDSAILLLLVEIFGFHYLVAAAIAFTLGAAALYFISVRWVFNHRRLIHSQWEFLLFISIGVAGLAVTIAVMWIVTGWLGIDYRLSKVVAAGASFLSNFALRKLLLFTGVTKNAVV